MKKNVQYVDASLVEEICLQALNCGWCRLEDKKSWLVFKAPKSEARIAVPKTKQVGRVDIIGFEMPELGPDGAVRYVPSDAGGSIRQHINFELAPEQSLEALLIAFKRLPLLQLHELKLAERRVGKRNSEVKGWSILHKSPGAEAPAQLPTTSSEDAGETLATLPPAEQVAETEQHAE